MNREEEMIQCAMPLVFGIFGQTERAPDQREVPFGGSGLFIAPFQTLTARHVNQDLLRMNPERVMICKGGFGTLSRMMAGCMWAWLILQNKAQTATRRDS
jgi:hypothetical protein